MMRGLRGQRPVFAAGRLHGDGGHGGYLPLRSDPHDDLLDLEADLPEFAGCHPFDHRFSAGSYGHAHRRRRPRFGHDVCINPRLYFFQADTAGQFAAVSFAADLSDSFPNSGMFGGERIRRVSFYVPPGGHDLVLEQNSLLADFERGGEPASIILAREVQLFQLEFWDGQQRDFVEEWLSTNQLPVIVRVTLGFGVSKGSREPAQIVSRVVRLPTVAVPREAQGVIGGAP